MTAQQYQGRIQNFEVCWLVQLSLLSPRAGSFDEVWMLLHQRSMPYPDHLKENMPMICPNSWVADQVREKCGAYGRYPREEEDALNIKIGCRNSVIIFLCT